MKTQVMARHYYSVKSLNMGYSHLFWSLCFKTSVALPRTHGQKLGGGGNEREVGREGAGGLGWE